MNDGELPIFFREKSKEYFLILGEENPACFACGVSFGVGESLVVFHDFFIKRRGVLHLACVKNLPHRHDFNVTFVVALGVAAIPKGSKLAVLSRVEFVAGNGGGSVWDVALSSDGAALRDRTRLAGRESWEGASIGVPDAARLAELDRPVRGEAEAFALLDGLRDAVPVLPEHDGKKLLELRGRTVG